MLPIAVPVSTFITNTYYVSSLLYLSYQPPVFFFCIFTNSTLNFLKIALFLKAHTCKPTGTPLEALALALTPSLF